MLKKMSVSISLLIVFMLLYSCVVVPEYTGNSRPHRRTAAPPPYHSQYQKQCDPIEIDPPAEFHPGQEWRTCSGYRFTFQRDRNLVLYNPNGTAIWATMTQNSRANRLVMQRDGNLVLYDGRIPVWASNSQGNYRDVYLAIQEDGNIVIYDGDRAVWNTRTQNR